MALTKLVFLLIATLLTCSSLPSVASAARTPPAGPSLAVRLQAVGGTMACWDSLLELRACTGEVVLFFLNGETYLGPSCCRAIRVIQHSCWPAMLGALGFTPEEGDVLRGYCDAANSSTTPPPSPASPSPASSAAKKLV